MKMTIDFLIGLATVIVSYFIKLFLDRCFKSEKNGEKRSQGKESDTKSRKA